MRGQCYFLWGGGSVTPCASPPLRPSIFSDSCLVHHLVNRDDRHVLAHAMASDFCHMAVAGGQCYDDYFLQKNNVFLKTISYLNFLRYTLILFIF
jgi:hypothetical protein